MKSLTVNKYVVAILDQDNARGQCGLYYLNSVHTMEDIITKFGISARMKTALGDRWEIHVSHMPADGKQDTQSLKNISGVILSVIKRLEVLEEEQIQKELGLTPDGAIDWQKYGTKETTINLPANTPKKDGATT